MRGRKIDWEEIIRKQKYSGKTIPEFCREIGIHPNTFYKHNKIQKEKGVVEIKPKLSSVQASPIVIKKGDFSISVEKDCDEEALKSVLKVIGEL